MLWALLVGAASLGGPEAVLVAIGEPQRLTSELERASAAAQRDGVTLLSAEEVALRLTGSREPRRPDEAALLGLLADAREREARFDTEGAQAARRHLVEAFDQALAPSERLRQLTTESYLDQCAAEVAAGNREAAAALAHELGRRFGAVEVDGKRYPPAVRELVQHALATLDAALKRRLLVHLDAPGEVLVEGRSLGTADHTLEAHLVPGTYRVWVVAGGALGLPYAVDLREGDGEVVVSSHLDARLRLGAPLSLSCSPCTEELRLLERRLGAPLVVVRPEVAASAPQVVAAAGLEPYRFRPWHLLPAGAGQWLQDRPLVGAGFLAATLSAAGWHLHAWRRHESALDQGDRDGEARWRGQRNVSAALLYGALAASIAEAGVYALLAD